jgi:hypothetical protein
MAIVRNIQPCKYNFNDTMANSKNNEEGNIGCVILILLVLLVIIIQKCSSNNKVIKTDYTPTHYPSLTDTTTLNTEEDNKTKKGKRRKKSTNNYGSSSYQSYDNSSRTRSSSNGRQLIRGSRGGCYYINANGNKVYVDRSLCN